MRDRGRGRGKVDRKEDKEEGLRQVDRKGEGEEERSGRKGRYD